MNIRIARYFMAIAQHGSMRDAAATLRVAQPALSRAILNLETELGLPLFERHSRGVNLTAAGEIYLRYARDQLTQSEHMRGDLDALKGVRRGTVRISTVESFARSFLPRLIGRFWKLHPEVAFDVKTESSEHLTTAIREVESDIGLTYNSLIASGIEVRLRVREPLVALVAAGHPLAKAETISMLDASKFPAALTTKSSRSRFLVDEACRAEQASLTPVIETNYIELLTRVVEESRAVTFLLRHSAADKIGLGSIKPVRVRNELMNRGTVEIITRASRKLSPAAEEFIVLVSQELQPGGEL